MADAGVQVPRDSLQPGDLLIFREPGHVGIYVGDSLFIHSSSYMNVGVVLTPIGQTNYVRRFVSAVRVTP
jgi:cell wall-associated NlpC family hydrolase